MKVPGILKPALRWIGTIAALGYVVWKTDLSGFNPSVPWWSWLGLLALYLASKISSAYRSKRLLEQIHFQESIVFHLKLYAKGMFYNLLFPGGVGGDAWKVLYLKQKQQQNWKETAAAFLYERLSGMAALLGLGGLLLLPSFPELLWYAFGLIGLGLVLGWWGSKTLFKAFHAEFIIGNSLSIGVQVLQGLGFICLAYTFHPHIDIPLATALFFLSSVASALPLTVGGIGAREALFLWLGPEAGLVGEQALTLSFGVTLAHIAVSLPGAFMRLPDSIPSNKVKGIP